MTKDEVISLSCQTDLACLGKKHELFACVFSTHRSVVSADILHQISQKWEFFSLN